jgi:hypothetical protein
MAQSTLLLAVRRGLADAVQLLLDTTDGITPLHTTAPRVPVRRGLPRRRGTDTPHWRYGYVC